jgi:PII-like signaling protein
MVPAKLIEIRCSEQDQWQGKPLYAAIVELCRSLGMAGATVLRGLEGYGVTASIHRKHLLRNDAPVTILVVDSAERIQALAQAVEPMLETAMLTVSDAIARRVRAEPAPGAQ